MVNALYSSKQGGTKMFTLHGVEFGWQAIVDLWQRECSRREHGNARMVPKLRESHVLRDSWTKLNVAPAKIMQVCTYVQHIILKQNNIVIYTVQLHICTIWWQLP